MAKLTVQEVVAEYGKEARAKLSNPVAFGQPEEQLVGPFEDLLKNMADLCDIGREKVIAVGESAVADLKTRPDFAVTVHGSLAGFVELKAPGKGADPRRFTNNHDKHQWKKLCLLPNLLYTDGNSFSLWQDGKLACPIITLTGSIESAGLRLETHDGLLGLFERFLRWKPIAPRNAKDLARICARLCRLLRDDVTEQLACGSESLTALATDWRKLLFPNATDERFADGYAQAVTFGMLMARARNICLSKGLQQAAQELHGTSTLIGEALRLLTHDSGNQQSLSTSLGTLTRVLDAVDWDKISSRGKKASEAGSHAKAETWLYFYEDFLEVYDNKLRKKTGSYYTPPEVVSAMVSMVDQVLRSQRFGQHAGLASPAVTLADPATGTGTFLLGVLQKIHQTVASDEGEGAASGAVQKALQRLIAFEIQLGPFAVAQLRILAEIVELTGSLPKTPMRMFVTDTLGDPEDYEGWIPSMYGEIAKSRKEANKIKRGQPITVILGNPPYKEKAKGLGGWVEGKDARAEKSAPLAKWKPPKEWGVGSHTKHLRNLYVYFWRWATRKVFDQHPGKNTGIVCFITVAGFLNGPGFQKMRDYLRRTCDDIWVIDCSPEGHQPKVNTRIFQDVQQPICIVLASRSKNSNQEEPANVLFRALPTMNRIGKFEVLADITLDGKDWTLCSPNWRAPFLPESQGVWTSFPPLEELFSYNGCGVMPGRTWIIAPDTETLYQRWNKLVNAPEDQKEELFHPHTNKGKLGDRHIRRVVKSGLPGFSSNPKPISQERESCVVPIHYCFRSFDRQWIIPDKRLINRPNPNLWRTHSNQQIYLTTVSRTAPSSGPALTVTSLIPDYDHYNARGGRVFPLWSDTEGTESNFRPKLLFTLSKRYGANVLPVDFMAYVVGITAHSGFSERFRKDLIRPGLRIPITADKKLFEEASQLGRTVIWLHTFGERMADSKAGRPAGPPRLPRNLMPQIPRDGAIPQESETMPDSIDYDTNQQRLLVGKGYVEGVPPTVWNYEVSGKHVLLQWFSYRKAKRERPIIGDRRTPSPLCKIYPDTWQAEYTTELINVLNVLGLLVILEPQQATLLKKICDGPLLSVDELYSAGAFELPSKPRSRSNRSNQSELF